MLQVFGVSAIDDDPPFIVSQYNPNGNANEFLSKNPTADLAKIVSTAIIVSAYNIYHRVNLGRCSNVRWGCNIFTG